MSESMSWRLKLNQFDCSNHVTWNIPTGVGVLHFHYSEIHKTSVQIDEDQHMSYDTWATTIHVFTLLIPYYALWSPFFRSSFEHHLLGLNFTWDACAFMVPQIVDYMVTSVLSGVPRFTVNVDFAFERERVKKSVIQGLKKEKYNGGDGQECCAVCLEEFLVGMQHTRLPCSHVFHDRCILPWFDRSGSCPTCRKVLEKDV